MTHTRGGSSKCSCADFMTGAFSVVVITLALESLLEQFHWSLLERKVKGYKEPKHRCCDCRKFKVNGIWEPINQTEDDYEGEEIFICNACDEKFQNRGITKKGFEDSWNEMARLNEPTDMWGSPESSEEYYEPSN